MLGNLINRHDAVRLCRKLRQGHLRQIAAKVRTPGPQRVVGFWSAPGPGAAQMQWDDIPAIRRRWHTFGGLETRFPDGRTKRRVIRPSRLSMRLDDPSEAVESSDLMPALHRRFAVPEAHPYGSILHLALHGIAANFLAGDPGTAQLMRQCLAAEDQALSRLGHDFTYAVCSPRLEPGLDLQAGHVTATRAGAAARPGYDAA